MITPTTPTPAQPAEPGEALKPLQRYWIWPATDELPEMLEAATDGRFCTSEDVTALESRLAERDKLITDISVAAFAFIRAVYGPWPKKFDLAQHRANTASELQALLQRAKQALEVRG